MEDVLSVYTRPRDPDRPLVCLDETSKQLVAETRIPVAMKPGRPTRVDYEYTRNGVANLFMMFAPLEGWRHVKVTDRRTAIDYAYALKDLADVHFAQAATIVLVQDNLNTHAAASLYEAFPAAEARRLVERFEWRYTPKHGSWLNLAESELGVLASRCLDRRIPDKQTIADEVAAGLAKRNADHAAADWRFTTEDARVKLKSLYPSLSMNRAARLMQRTQGARFTSGTAVTGGHGRSHFSDSFMSDTAYKLGDIKDGYSERSNTRGAPRRSSDGPRRLANGAANPWNRLKRTRKWRPAAQRAKTRHLAPPPNGYVYFASSP